MTEDLYFDFEEDIIAALTIREYIAQFDPEIRNIFYNAYGKSLEGMPREFLQPGVSMDLFLERLLSLSNKRSQKVILMRFGFVDGTPMTLQEVADAFDITRERVRQIEHMFLRGCRAHVRRRRRISYPENS